MARLLLLPDDLPWYWEPWERARKQTGKELAKLTAQDARFIWRRWPLFCLPYSTATVEWRIPANIVPGTYRVSIYGEGKRLFGPLRSYAGTSREFRVS